MQKSKAHVDWRLKLKKYNIGLEEKAATPKEMFEALYRKHGTCAAVAKSLGVTDRAIRYQMKKHAIQYVGKAGPKPKGQPKSRAGGGSVMHQSRKAEVVMESFTRSPCLGCEHEAQPKNEHPICRVCPKPEAYAKQIEGNGVVMVARGDFCGVYSGAASFREFGSGERGSAA